MQSEMVFKPVDDNFDGKEEQIIIKENTENIKRKIS